MQGRNERTKAENLLVAVINAWRKAEEAVSHVPETGTFNCDNVKLKAEGIGPKKTEGLIHACGFSVSVIRGYAYFCSPYTRDRNMLWCEAFAAELQDRGFGNAYAHHRMD
jgi:hypothetical protein